MQSIETLGPLDGFLVINCPSVGGSLGGGGGGQGLGRFPARQVRDRPVRYAAQPLQHPHNLRKGGHDGERGAGGECFVCAMNGCFVFLCVCVCTCVNRGGAPGSSSRTHCRTRRRGTDGCRPAQPTRQQVWVSMSVCVCACVCMCVCMCVCGGTVC